MNSNLLSEDTKAVILLCSPLGKGGGEEPLSLVEYASLVRALVAEHKRPKDLLQQGVVNDIAPAANLDAPRLQKLLSRGVQLGFAVEEWQRSGIWIISRSDADYPARFKQHLKSASPPLLFGTGNRALLSGGGLGIVGSRNMDAAGESFTRQLAKQCAENNMPVISGGARGVDQTAISAALDAGGIAIAILADNLLKKSVERQARKAIAQGTLLLCSPHHPAASFSIGNAMSRNKLLYALSDYAVVVSAKEKKGGTWSGATEELKRKNARPVFVRNGANTPEGNKKLLVMGAMPWPDSFNGGDLKSALPHLTSHYENNKPSQRLDLFSSLPNQKTTSDDSQATEVLEPQPTLTSDMPPKRLPKS